MKVALLLYGQPRTFETTARNLKEVFCWDPDVDIDIYVFSWDGDRTHRASQVELFSKSYSGKELENLLRKHYDPVNIQIESENVIGISPSNGQSYALKSVVTLAKKSDRWYEYDWVYVTRMDLMWIGETEEYSPNRMDYSQLKLVLQDYSHYEKEKDKWNVEKFDRYYENYPEEEKYRFRNGTKLPGYFDLDNVLTSPHTDTPHWLKYKPLMQDWIIGGRPRAVDTLADYQDFIESVGSYNEKSLIPGTYLTNWHSFRHRYLEGGLPLFLNIRDVGIVRDPSLFPVGIVIYRQEHQVLGIDPYTRDGFAAIKIPEVRWVDYRKKGCLEEARKALREHGLKFTSNLRLSTEKETEKSKKTRLV